jgi:hypothetical protein
MMALVNTKRLAILAWAVANASLVLLIGVELGWGKKLVQPMPVPVVSLSEPIEIVLPPDFRLPALEKAFAGTLERSLFVPTRRKAPPPPPPPPPTMQKGQFQLLGTTITDEFSIAIVKEVSSGKVRQIYKGYTINGLQLDLVESDRIVFSQYDDREEIRLKIQASPKPAAAPQTASQGEQPAKNPAISATSSQPQPALGKVKAQGALQSRNRRSRDQEQDQPPLPQSIEERKNDPKFKDFYK